MRYGLSRKTPTIGQWLAGLFLFVTAWLHGVGVQAADILLTGVEDSPGMQSFVQALSQLRPIDHVHFRPLASLPAPGKLPSNLRLILLDMPSLDWRLQDTQGPATLVLRISRLQAQQRFGSILPSRLSLLWSDPPLSRQLQLIRQLLPQGRRVGVLFDAHSEFLLKELN